MVIERMAYEPFGKRRFISGQFDQAGTIDAQSTNRGFTGHEHLDSLDFIHMNARVYDPDIGRFLSPDPTVPYVHNPQSFNRYSYTQNNPLNRVDPDGFRDSTNKQQVAEAIARMAAENGKTVGSKGPNASVAAHEAQTAANPTYDAADYKAQPYADLDHPEAGVARGLKDGFQLGVEFGSYTGAARSAYTKAAAHLSSVKGSLNSGWQTVKDFFGFGAKAPEKVAKAAAVEVNAAKAALGNRHARDSLLQAANQPINESGLTAVARAWDKHDVTRPGGTFPQFSGSIAQKNKNASDFLTDLVDNKSTTRSELGRGGVQFRGADGKGARFGKDGSFEGLVDPKTPD